MRIKSVYYTVNNLAVVHLLLSKPNFLPQQMNGSTGGEILRTPGLQSVYANGQGSIVMRAMTAIEGLENGEKPKSKGRSSSTKIVITELPYQLCKVCASLKTSANANTLHFKS